MNVIKKHTVYKRVVLLIFIVYCISCGVVLPAGLFSLRQPVRALEQSATVITDVAAFKDAVAKAASGDTITVAGEIVLSERITLQKNITVKKADGAEKAVFLLSASPLNTGRHFIIDDNTEAAFINIGFKGHGGLSHEESSKGGGIEARRKSKLTLTGCSFWGNNNRFGGAVEMQESGSMSIDKCSFTYNRSTYMGGAIYVAGLYPDSEDEDSFIFDNGVSAASDSSQNFDNLSLVTISDSIIENNHAEYCGGGIQFNDFSEGEVRNCVINNNRLTKKGDIYLDGGGGIAVGTAKVGVFSSIISNNEAENGGGLHFNYMGYSEKLTSVIADCIISKNTAYGKGGGIFAFRKSAVTFYGCAIYENVAELGGGACIGEKGDSMYDTEASADFVFCTVAFNRSTLEGGGLYVTDSVTAVYGTIIAGNTTAGEALPKTFTMGADSIYSEEYNELFTEKHSYDGQIEIKPDSPAHNKISQAEVDEWLKNISLAPLLDIIGTRKMYGGAYDIGAFEIEEDTLGIAFFFIIAGSVLLIAGSVTGVFLRINKKRTVKLLADIPQECPPETVYPELDSLTSRETEVFRLLIAGNTLRQIAGELKIEYTTVNFHYKNIYKKLQVNSRVELIKKYGKFE